MKINPQTEPRTVEVTRQNTPLNATLHAWQAPTETDPDSYAVDLLTNILADRSQSSRLYRRLVDEEQAAMEVERVPVFPGTSWDGRACSRWATRVRRWRSSTG